VVAQIEADSTLEPVPADLKERLIGLLDQNPELAWDQALNQLKQTD